VQGDSLRVSIFGLGYVGAVSLACLARDGHEVTGVDVNPAKLDLIRGGVSPVIEERMPELMRAAAESGRVRVTTDTREAAHGSDVSFITVGTPSATNGSVNLEAVLSVTRSLGEALKDKAERHTLVYRSTVTPGTTEERIIPLLEQTSGKKAGAEFEVAFQPEFLREGSSVRDYDNPPFVVVGSSSPGAVARVRELFGHLPAAFHETSFRAAELLKVCCNNFHALKIAFANEVARLCEPVGCDPFEVMRLLCEDRQLNISPAYLKPGFAFGGSCLPKDLRSALYIAKSRDVELPVMSSILLSNRLHLEHAVRKILETRKTRVALIGLSFKTGTDDLRESPMVTLAEHLLGKGLKLAVHDPEVEYARLVGANRQYIETLLPHVGSLLTGSCEAAIEQSDVVVVAVTSREVLAKTKAALRPDHVLIDLAGALRGEDLPCPYTGLSW
jgi:GDP-mannose 6-dehydrogenase